MTALSSAPAAMRPASLASMTAFARASASEGRWRFAWEVRSVNGKGLDLRLRLPPGCEDIEAQVRARAGAVLARGSVSATLTAAREGEDVAIRVNEAGLESLVRAVRRTAEKFGAPAPGLDALLAVKGIVEVTEAEEDEAGRHARAVACLAAFEVALAELCAMREREGQALQVVLLGRLDAISALVEAAERLPERSVEAIRARLAEQVRVLLEAGPQLDPERLHQEAVMLATKADIREELDRLAAHVAAARELLGAGGPVGRRLDFLAQEFNREANTLCSKSNTVALTQIGLDLKLLVDQFREQIQNLE
ncbi:YicC/YloC family endoribonuclease [Xanthobacter sp. V0B-10]|uniref:YicC/YloC family endoribonuclease n=1 Tax=Xanthobacter albus TaxID=3119929 RepID=UPI0037275BE3